MNQAISETKLCPGCGEDKDLSEYHKDKSKKYGVASICKICRVPDCKKYYDENKDTIKTNYNEWRKTEAGKKSNLVRNKRYNEKYPERLNARKFIKYCIRQGAMLPASEKQCRCGKQAEHYHHPNGYEGKHLLDVVPLCQRCHVNEHIEMNGKEK